MALKKRTAAPVTKSAEQLLRAYFHKQEIAFKYKEVKVDLPPGMAHKFVLPDFYLPELKIAVEYMEYWDDPRFRPRLLEKRELYQHATVPCIFVYPKDLENLDTAFTEKLREAQYQLSLQQHDAQEVRFSLTIAVLCILLGIPLALFRYTKYLGWISLGYGIVLLFMRHPHLVAAALRKFGHALLLAFQAMGRALLIFLKALGRGSARLVIIIARGIVILSKLLWKLSKLFAIYLWLALRALVQALWWILIHLWYGILTGFVGIWHGLLWFGLRLWRGLRFLAHYLWIGVQHAVRGIGIGSVYGGKGLWAGLRAAVRGLGFLLRSIWRGILIALQAFGSGIYQAKHALQEKAKERKLAALEAKRAEKEKLAKQRPKGAKGKKRKAA